MSYYTRQPSRVNAPPRFLAVGTILILVFLGFVITAPPAAAQQGEVPHELVVLLGHGPNVPSPAQVVDAARQQRPLPGGLELGDPTADFVLKHRAAGRLAERLATEPNSPRARLERYLVLIYPPAVDVEVIADALRRNPHVVSVHRNRYAQVSVVPDDPLMVVTGSAVTHQWGPYELSLPAAWNYTKGHGYLGIVDTGIDTDHPDHLGLHQSGGVTVWDGGNYRPHLSYDYGYDDANPDEGEAPSTVNAAGHGTHVAGIAAGSTNNDHGIAGTCWNCSLLIGKVSTLNSNGTNQTIVETDLAEGITGMVDNGAQVINLSLGIRPPDDCSTLPLLCDALDHADDRDVVIAAAAGNDGSTSADFPSTDPRVIGVGGIEFGGGFWNDCPGTECGSNEDPNQLVMPAKEVLSTFYLGIPYVPSIDCDSSLLPSYPGHGPCTGTSMSAPFMTGAVGLLRSINPLLSKTQIRNLLDTNLINPPGWNPVHGLGKPDLNLAAQDALGRVNGQVLDNRLTPLFSMYSPVAEDHMYTTVPQWGSVKHWASVYYVNEGPGVPGYGIFPDTQCVIGPCPPGPGASVYVFSTDRSPNGHPLVPLYRLNFEGTFPGGPSNPDNADHNYTTEAAGLTSFGDVGYRLDGVEGYIYERCSPEPSCIPAGAVRLYRLYNATRDDWAIFPESELADFQADGYTSQACCNDWIGYVYENVDSDFDQVIDGFETLIGTNPNDSDSDCDGVSDGQEIVQYPYSDPLGAPGCSTSQVIGEVGQVTDSLTHTAQTVSFSRSYSNPVVIAQPASFDGGHVSVVRITSVTSSGFTFFVDEAPNHDGPHTTETVSWVVLEAGRWALDDGTQLEVGKVNTNATVGTRVAGSFQTVSFKKAFPVAPAVHSQVQTNNDPAWVKTRQQLASTTSVRVALEEEEASNTFHGTETVGWVAIEPGTGTWSGKRYQSAVSANVVTDAFTTLSLSGFTAAPRFVASMATRNGGNNSGLRYRNLGASSVQVKVEEDTTWDTEVAHISEQVAFLAIQGNGTLEASPQ